jgi:signal transduction histidine kinase
MSDYVLCIDDEPAVLNQLSALLARRLGSACRIECAESADEALALIDELHAAGDHVQLVICDQVMPGMKGDRFLEAVHRRWPEIMKILLTGEAGLESAIYAINNAGLNRYIEKPWQAEDLLLEVEKLLTQYRLRREMALYNERLERKSRELHSLHRVGIDLAASEDLELVASLVAEAAHRLAGGDVAVLAQLGTETRWSGAAQSPLFPGVRQALESLLVQYRAEPRDDVSEVPGLGRAVSIRHGGTFYGWIFVPEALGLAADTSDLLKILAMQAGASLHRIELIAARVESERLSAIGRMLSSIVHDFRNPMTLIKGYGSMVGDSTLSDERRAQYASLIVEEADRMSAMIEELLDYTRGRRTPLHPARIPVPELVNHLRRWIAGELEQRGLTLETRLDYAGPLVIDIDRMKRALLNIANNAMESMDRGGVLTVESRCNDTHIELALADTGRGIPADMQAKVFEPFFTHGKRGGLGLGMTIMRRIVEEHGGEVHLQSAPGAGTRLTLRFPTTPPPPPASSAPA